MNNKGFTLIEVIATIALLAVISVISFVSISKIVLENKKKECNSLVNNIEIATKEYVSDYRYDNTNFNNLTANDLINKKYLTGPIYNPFTNSQLNASNIKIAVSLKADRTVNNVTIKNGSSTVNCESGSW